MWTQHLFEPSIYLTQHLFGAQRLIEYSESQTCFTACYSQLRQKKNGYPTEEPLLKYSLIHKMKRHLLNKDQQSSESNEAVWFMSLY